MVADPLPHRQEIEDWIERSQRYGLGDFWTKKRKYKEDTASFLERPSSIEEVK
jgi:hypothetical protein